MTKPSWFDRIALGLAPRWQLKRIRSRMAAELVLRHYEGGGNSRRTQTWNRSNADATGATGPYLARLRGVSLDLVRNNPYAESGIRTIVEHTVGWGIVPKMTRANPRAEAVWKAWAETTACDADGQHDFAGLQKLVMRTVAVSGEVLVRRRLRRPEDGWPIPMQLQVLEPDFLDTSKDSLGITPGLPRIVQGVEFDPIGKRAAYWLFPEHPGSVLGLATSVRVPAANVLHIFRTDRPGQVRGVPWLASDMLRFKDFDEFEDATLMKQKIAACLAVITTDSDGSGTPLGTADEAVSPQTDSLEPGMILNVPAGRDISVVQPPNVGDYDAYSQNMLRAIATGLGVTFEDLTGNYTDLPFSAARMSRIRHWASVEDWRWRIMIPQFCGPAWAWAMEVAQIFGAGETPEVTWTAPPAPMVDPVNEGLAYQRNIRTGIMSLSEALRERGYDPATVLNEMAADNKLLDKLKLILDSDARQMTQAGQLQGMGLPTPVAAPAPVEKPAEKAPLRLVSGE